MHAHLADLRAEVGEIAEDERERWLRALGTDWRSASLSAQDAALCALAEKLTRTPAAMLEADVAGLRGLGLEDRAVHDTVQVVAYFNYINRVADALCVDLEPEMPQRPGA